MRLILYIFFLCGLLQVSAADFPVSRYGAVGDGVTLNTMAIQRAIDACAAAGGGRVIIGEGTFLSGTLVLKSHVELHLLEGALLLGSTNLEHYPEKTTPYRFYGDQWVRQSLIFAYDQEQIALSGEGVIDGQELLSRSPQKRNRPLPRPALPDSLYPVQGDTGKWTHPAELGHVDAALPGL